MKKLILTIVGLFICSTIFSQTCVEDVWQCLRNNQAPKARTFVEECLKNNPDNAQVWLMRANVYIELYSREQAKMQADPAYKSRFPDAIMTANESFVKALELDPTVKPKTGMIAPKYGQQLCAEPLYLQGINALQNKDFANAIKYISIAARNYELGADSTSKLNAASCHFNLAIAYEESKDDANYKKALQKAVSLNSPNPNAYLLLYDIYKKDNDTTNCKAIIEKGLKNVPAYRQSDLIATQMDLYAFTNQKEALIALCDKILQQAPNDTTLIGASANYLSNVGAYTKAEEILTNALTKYGKCFELNKQMGYRYYMEALDYAKMQDAAMAAKEYDKVNKLRTDEKTIIQKAHDWCQKAYEINGENRVNNIMLQQLKVKLLIPVPDELKAKVDSYRAK